MNGRKRGKRVLTPFLWALALCAAAGALAQAPARYVEVPRTVDGIGKAYLGRPIARVMSYHGAAWLERDERAREELPERVLDALALAPGMAVADIGAGTGFYARRIARRVGARGTVYAVDIQPEMLRMLADAMAAQGVANVRPVLGEPADPRLAPASLDLAVMVDVYHELEYPYEMLAAIVRALKPGGRVAFVEFRSDDPNVPIRPLHTMTAAQVRKEAAVQGLQWVRTVRDLPMQNVVVFRKRR